MGDVHHILHSSIQQPVAQIFYDVLGKAGGVTFSICGVIIIKFVCFTAMQSLGRTVFAFSRDRLVPFSSLWTKILPLTGTPILAVWISTFFCIVINLIGLGSYTAILGVFNVTAIALDWSYCEYFLKTEQYASHELIMALPGIPIFCKLIFGKFERGPWHLGKASFWVNLVACIWTTFVSVS